MQPTNKTARFAGFLYLLMGASAPFCLIYVPRTLIVRGNATATANNILAHEMLFRAGMVAELFIAVMWIFLAVVFYRLFNGVNQTQAALMAILGGLVCAPMSFLNVANELVALTLVRGADYLSVFDKSQLEALAMLFLRLHGQVIVVEQIFWGLWLFPFGLLVMRSGFLPRILGVLLILNGFPYVIGSLASLLLPGQTYSVLSVPAIILQFGELWIMLWLLIKGARVEPLTAAAASA